MKPSRGLPNVILLMSPRFLFIPVPKAHVPMKGIRPRGAKMEGNEGECAQRAESSPIEILSEPEKEKMAEYWADLVNVYSNLWELIQERHEELLGSLGQIDTSNPYLMGFETGLRTGCQLSQDLIVVAFDQAASKEHVLPDELRRFNNGCLHALRVAALRRGGDSRRK